jgi:uncharacterized membrane protein
VRRLDYIDWMRGLACLLMFQTHCYDAWLRDDLRGGRLLMYSQLGGTFPAPLFLFLAGISLALGVDRLEEKGAPRRKIAANFARRGLEILVLGLLFRFQQFAFALGWAPWTDLLRVDILNTIGLSLALCSLTVFVPGLGPRVALASGTAALIAMLTPPLWTTWKPDSLPWWLASYINGGHVTYQPRGWFFPIFPWTGFAFAGAAAGALLMRARRAGREGSLMMGFAAVGVGFFFLARFLDHSPLQLYEVYNYWLTSPNFFLARVGLLLVILALCYAWCALKPGKLWSPVTQLGTTSLLVYWVHIELVYGKLSILPKRASTEWAATLGLAGIAVAMTLLSVWKTRWVKRRAARHAA